VSVSRRKRLWRGRGEEHSQTALACESQRYRQRPPVPSPRSRTGGRHKRRPSGETKLTRYQDVGRGAEHERPSAGIRERRVEGRCDEQYSSNEQRSCRPRAEPFGAIARSALDRLSAALSLFDPGQRNWRARQEDEPGAKAPVARFDRCTGITKGATQGPRGIPGCRSVQELGFPDAMSNTSHEDVRTVPVQRIRQS
jgi:hypothetical protein